MTQNTSHNDDAQWRPLALSLVCLGVAARLVPHWPNFTPIGATGLLAGARMRGWRAFMVPLLAMAISDPLLSAIYGFRPFSRMTVFVYASFLINVLIGRALRTTESAQCILTAALLGSLQFFAITNFAVWILGRGYPHNAAGLMACYVAALPFLANTVAGDLFYVGVLFGLHAWLSRRVFPRERVQANVAAA
jgi:hypothetical protein